MSLEKVLLHHVARQPFTMGIGGIHMASGDHFGVLGDELFPTASTFKVPVLYALMQQVDRGVVDLNEKLSRGHMPSLGSGIMAHLSPDTTLSIRDLAYLMITVSDNLATDLILSRIGGTSTVTNSMMALGLTRIHVTMDCFTLLCTGLGWNPNDRKVRSRVLNNPDLLQDHEVDPDSLIFGQVPENNVVSPNQMCELLKEILYPTQISAASAHEITSILKHQNFKHRLPAMLPVNVRTLNKTGTVAGVRCDVGAMFLESGPVVLSAFILNAQPSAFWQADHAIAKAARLVYDYYS